VHSQSLVSGLIKPDPAFSCETNEGTVMFLKRVDGPRQVTLPDGSILSRADLPPADTRRWVASRKAVVVRAVVYGLISEKEALDRYALSEEVTAIQKYRQL
jgi:Protein of unknown function (DUF1153)